MKILILLAILSTLSFSTTFALERGFVESQVVYEVNEDGDKLFNQHWDEEEKLVTIEMTLKLNNYRSEWHDGGFNLNMRRSVYSTVPEFRKGCQLIEASGIIGDGITYKKSYLTIKLKGENCPGYLFMYQQFGISLSFYNVFSIDGKSLTPVMRLYVVDNP